MLCSKASSSAILHHHLSLALAFFERFHRRERQLSLSTKPQSGQRAHFKNNIWTSLYKETSKIVS